MADEITATAIILYAKGNIQQIKRTLQSATFDVSGEGYFAQRQTIGTSEEALAIGDVTNCGWFWGKNLSSTTAIKIRLGSGAADLVKISPAACCLFELAGNNPYAIAVGAPAALEYMITER